jgi:dynein intermediate chain
MADRKAELERKKAKLEELRKEKERRRLERERQEVLKLIFTFLYSLYTV